MEENICNYCHDPKCKIKTNNTSYIKKQWKLFKETFIWKEIVFDIVSFICFFMMFHWWGIITTILLRKILTIGGGNYL